MERPELLFAKYDFHSAVRNAPAVLARAIDELPDSDLLEKDPANLVDGLVKDNMVRVPILDLNAVAPSQREVDVDVSGDPHRFFGHHSGPFYIKATEISFRVPFKGDPDVFRCRPSSFSLNPPRADVESDAIVIRVVREDQKAAEYRKEFDRTIQEIQGALDQLRSDCAGLEQTLRQTATAQVAKRREKRGKDRDLLGGLGFGTPDEE